MKTSPIMTADQRQKAPAHVSLLILTLAALALLFTARPAAADAAASTTAKPIVTHAQVEHAREICAQHKRKVERLEAGNAGDAVLSKERAAWEESCAQASDLMDAIGMN
ncbi:MAG TPA: hypothetical protein VN046_02700 [Stenotrophobium sp.]|nr:hypothetical protein [Stenotrophobium sp.]